MSNCMSIKQLKKQKPMLTHTIKQEIYNTPSTFRNALYWLSDFLKGSKRRRHYDAITLINKDHESDYATQERKKYLSDILSHTIQTVPFYRMLFETVSSLEQFPVVNKNLIRNNYKSFCSESYSNKKTFKATTSGSTGTPFTVLHNIGKKKRHMSDVRYFLEAVGHDYGTGFYYLKIWNKQNRKSALTKKVQNIIAIDVLQLNDQKISELLKNIHTDNVPKTVLGYASALDSIVKYLECNPTEMSGSSVVSVIAMSESLDEHTKKYLQDYFECPVVSRYANLENGMLAQQTTDSEGDFLANFASYNIEILDLKKDIPVRNGEMGRIVVTDLFNRAMPLIRYDTGDLGVFGKLVKNGRTQYFLKKVEGRKMDAIYHTNGALISSFSVTNSMWKYTQLKQYQFIQIGHKDYEFRLNSAGDFLLEEELINEFKDYLGSDARIGISYVNEIPLLSSGKRKKVLNKMKSNNTKYSYAL